MNIQFPGVPVNDELFLSILTSITGPPENASMIDLCSAQARLTQTLPWKRAVFVDVLPQPEAPSEKFVQADVLGVHPVFEQTYDVALCLDGIEHLPKDDGWRLIRRMSLMATRAVIFTPLHSWQMEKPGSDRWTDPTSHKSLWSPDDFKGFHTLIFPQCHQTLGIGAFFAFTK